MISRRIRALGWSDVLQDYVEIPLDDADSVTIELARRINGKEMTEDEFKRHVEEAQNL